MDANPWKPLSGDSTFQNASYFDDVNACWDSNIQYCVYVDDVCAKPTKRHCCSSNTWILAIPNFKNILIEWLDDGYPWDYFWCIDWLTFLSHASLGC